MKCLASSVSAAALMLALPSLGHAQQARVVNACGALAPFGPSAPGAPASLTVDPNGELCLAGTARGTDVRAFGCVADGVTDQTACINNALATAPDCVLIPASTSGFYVSGTLTVPRCMRGTVFNPSNAGLSFSGASFIKCNNQVARPCVVVNRTGNLSAQVENITLLGSGATPVPGSIGFQWQSGYNLILTNLQSANFDTCAYFGPTAGVGQGPISVHAYNTMFSQCQKHYVVDDGIPEVYLVGGRWGQNGGGDYNSADDFIYATKTTNAGLAGGPNTLVLDDLQINPGGTAVGCFLRWGGMTGTGGTFGSNKISNTRFEAAQGSQYTGSATRGIICIDSTVPHMPGLQVENTVFAEDPTVSMPFFTIDPAVPFDNDLKFVDSLLCAGSFSLTIKNLSATHAPTFDDNYICSAATFTAGDTSAQANLSNNVFASFTIAGQWSRLAMNGNAGALTDNATGAVFEANQLQRSWTPTIATTGGGETVAYTAQAGAWERTPYGGLTAYFSVTLSAFSGGSGTVYIGGFPKSCSGRAQAANFANWSGFSGLTDTPYPSWLSGAGINMVQAGSTHAGVVNLTPTNLTATTFVSGTVTCGLAQ
jgi:hypothetical protein